MSEVTNVELRAGIDALGADLDSVQRQFQGFRDEIAYLRDDVRGLRRDVEGVSGLLSRYVEVLETLADEALPVMRSLMSSTLFRALGVKSKSKGEL